MNKGEIRTRILEQVDWNPSQSTAFKAKVDRLINRAYQQLSLEAPFLFFEEECKIVTVADVSNDAAVALDVLAVNSGDKYVLERSYPTASASTLQSWSSNDSWDSRRVEITRSDGSILRRRIREAWSDTVGSDTYDRISLDISWPNNTDTGLTYRIHKEAYELPADVVELRSARLWSDQHYPLEINSQNDMERYEYIDYTGTESGRPHRIFRGRHVQIDAPNLSAQVSESTDTSWAGPQPYGKFDFCYTYVWGRRPSQLNTPTGLYEPRWESAPSPVSSTIEILDSGEGTGTPSGAINLSLPNIDQELNFYSVNSGGTITTPVRARRSGLKKRIYLRRYSTNTTPIAGVIEQIESPEIFFLLDEIEGHTIDYKVDGSIVPDYYRRLKETHGYQSIRLWPVPDAEYEIDCRVLRRPQQLIHDSDAPKIHEEACDLLIQKALGYFYEMNGQHDVVQLCDLRYQGELATLTKRYGQIAGYRPRKRAARITRGVRDVRVIYKP